MKTRKKETILSVLGLVVLVVFIIGITYAAFSYTKKGNIENTVKTGKITMSYTEGENGITLNNAYPIADNVGKVMSEQDQMFDFTVDINLYGNKLPISYEVTGEKDENSSLANEDIRIYLERASNGTDYTSVLEPSGYIPLSSDDAFGAKVGEMVLDEGTTNESVTFNYRLRMWVGESYKVTGEEKYFTMKVNVYGNDGVTVEVKGVELDKNSATLKLTNTLQLNAKTFPATPTDSSITWTSSNPKIASVTSTGLVEAKGIGIVTITATSVNGKSATASIKVEVDNTNIVGAFQYDATICPTGEESSCVLETDCLLNESTTCPTGTIIQYKVNDDTTQNFFVLKDNGNSLTLITDSIVVKYVNWNSSGSTSGGPVTATEALENVTSSWANVPSNIYNGATGIATRARLITKVEAEEAGCKEYQSDGSADNSCPTWLTESSNVHWTSIPSSDSSDLAWFVNNSSLGRLDVGYIYRNRGVRAVVTVSK